MNIQFDYKPLPIHEAFHRSTARTRIMFGAYGSGKSYGVIAEAIAWMLEQPGIRGAIARKTVPQLRDATEPIFIEMLPSDLLTRCEIKKSGGHIERIIFPNGSTVLFRSLDDPVKWRSLNLGFIAVDELNEISETDWNEIASRVRQRDITADAKSSGYSHEITRRGMWGSTNPAGHDWIWEMAHPTSPKKKPNVESFTSTTLDNPYLPPEYVESLLEMPKPYIERYVLCGFDDFAGKIYEDWQESTHLVKLPNMSREQWLQQTIWMGMDPGTRSPTAGLWCWWDADNHRLVAVGEYEQAGVSASAHAKSWKSMEALAGWRVNTRIADPNAITQRDRGTALSLQSQYARLGYHFSLGASSHHTRIPQLGALIGRRQFVVAETCPKTFEAIRDYQWVDLSPSQKAKGVEGPDTVLKKNTHLVECAQYLAGKLLPKAKLNPWENMDDKQAWNASIHADLKQQRRARMNRTANTDLGSVRV